MVNHEFQTQQNKIFSCLDLLLYFCYSRWFELLSASVATAQLRVNLFVFVKFLLRFFIVFNLILSSEMFNYLV